MSDSFASLELAVATILRSVPDTWTDYDANTLTATQEQAVLLLTAAGMIERRVTLRIRMAGQSVAMEGTLTFTGEHGFAQAVEPMIADAWHVWRESLTTTKDAERADAAAFLCERIGKEQWRLTAAGATARHDLAEGNSSLVFDFVLKRGFFDGRPRLLPNGRISQRLPVAGNGRLERMQRIRADAEPAGVHIANWDAGAKAFAAAFAEFFKTHAPHPPPVATTPPAAETPEEAMPSDDRSKGIPLAEAEVRVREWLKANAKANPAAITRDAVAKGTGISAGQVSNTSAWKAFRDRRNAESKPKAREVPLTDAMRSVVPSDSEKPDELAALMEEQATDEAEQERRHKRRHGPS